MRHWRRLLPLLLLLALWLPLQGLASEEALPYTQMSWPGADPALLPVPAPYGYRIVGKGSAKLVRQLQDGSESSFYMAPGVALPLAAPPDGSGLLYIRMPERALNYVGQNELGTLESLNVYADEITAYVLEKNMREPEPEELPAYALDTGCAAQGYIHAAARGTEPILLSLENNGRFHHVRIPPDAQWHPILLTLGDGDYTVRLYQAGLLDKHISLLAEEYLGAQTPPPDTELALLDSAQCDLLNNAALVAYAQDLCRDTDDDWEKFRRIRSVLYRNARYDTDYARTIRYTKIPEPEVFLKNGGRGICGDYAAFITVACRAVGIPAKMISGINPKTGGSHGWNEVYIGGEWWMTDVVTEKSGKQKTYEPRHMSGSGYKTVPKYWAGYE